MSRQAVLTATVSKPYASSKDQIIVALAGNPNAGKTTLFNALTGLRQKVANYTGVTVERKEGVWRIESGKSARLIDLPGLYSLNAASIDEEIARDALTGKISGLPVPDCIIAVVDATNLDRNLYLFTQILKYEIPVVIALTMIDEAEAKEAEIDAEKLSSYLKVPVIPIVAGRKRGLGDLTAAVENSVEKGVAPTDFPFFGEPEETKNGHASILARYAWISEAVQESVRERKTDERNFSEKLDRILTHKIFGLIILVGILLFVFQTIFSWASLPMDLLDTTFGALGDFVRNSMPPGLLRDLLADGVIAGVGGVMVFLPQIILLCELHAGCSDSM